MSSSYNLIEPNLGRPRNVRSMATLALHEHSSEFTLHLGNQALDMTGLEVFEAINNMLKAVSYSYGDEGLAFGLKGLKETLATIEGDLGLGGE